MSTVNTFVRNETGWISRNEECTPTDITERKRKKKTLTSHQVDIYEVGLDVAGFLRLISNALYKVVNLLLLFFLISTMFFFCIYIKDTLSSLPMNFIS